MIQKLYWIASAFPSLAMTRKGEGYAEPAPNCHAELVSASHAFCKLKQADKWNNEILKQVQDDISFLSSFLGLTRASSQTIARVIASEAKWSSLIIFPYKTFI